MPDGISTTVTFRVSFTPLFKALPLRQQYDKTKITSQSSLEKAVRYLIQSTNYLNRSVFLSLLICLSTFWPSALEEGIQMQEMQQADNA